MGFLRTLWRRIKQHDVGGLAAEITYHWVLSLVPTLIFLLSLFGMVGARSDFFEQMIRLLHRVLPTEAYDLLLQLLNEITRGSSTELAVVGFVGALWAATNGAEALAKAMTRIQELPAAARFGFWRQQLVALGIVWGMAFIVLICSNLLVFGDVLYRAITYFLHPADWWLNSLVLLRWTVSLGGLILVSAFIYWIVAVWIVAVRRHGSPAIPTHRPPVWPGAFLFVTLWILISWLFNVYVSNFGNYSKLYGSMGAIVVLMLWLYLTSYSMLIGGEVNAMLATQQDNVYPKDDSHAV